MEYNFLDLQESLGSEIVHKVGFASTFLKKTFEKSVASTVLVMGELLLPRNR